MQHHIDTGNASPVRQQPYRVSPTVRNRIDSHVNKMLNQGTIQPSVSPWAAPVVLVKKKDGSERFCVDYRKLNSVTRRDSHPIPNVQDTLDCLHGTAYFSCMDLRSGYWQVEMDDESKPKTAFATHAGLFEFRKMSFGLANAPSTFQRLMHAVLRGLQYLVCLVNWMILSSFLKHLKTTYCISMMSLPGSSLLMLSSNPVSARLRVQASNILDIYYLALLLALILPNLRQSKNSLFHAALATFAVF